MLYLLTYDIDTSHDRGRRLQKIAKLCESYGERVQDSVFELNLDASKVKELELRVQALMNEKEDSIRIYKLGKYTKYDVTVLGRKKVIELSEQGGLFI